MLRADVGGAPIPEGFNLYQALVQQYRMCVVLEDGNTAEAAVWLRKEGFRDYVQLHVQRPLDDRLVQLRRLQSTGTVELIIDANPDAITGAMSLGITGMLFGHPRVTRPEWRPDYERTPRPWDTLVEQVDKARMVQP